MSGQSSKSQVKLNITERVHTAWVLPPRDITGEDHLGVRAVGEAIYTELVPCVTNVTDRIRSYAFFPWFTWKFAQKIPKANYDEFVRMFRRAECLNTLIGAHHEAGGDAEAHGGGLAGRGTLLEPLRGLGSGRLNLSTFADPDIEKGSAQRYFTAELGGFDQYYRGTLQVLDIMGGNRQSGMNVSPGRGVRLAQAFDAGVPGELFWDTVASDEVFAERLEALVAFCPCHLEHQHAEAAAILDVLMNRDRALDVPEMRDALRLVCDFLAAGDEGEGDRDTVIWRFRESSYGAILPSGEWTDPAVPEWAAYHRHELLSVAVQTLFKAVFNAIEVSDRNGTLPSLYSSLQVAEWFVNRKEVAAADLDLMLPLAQLLEQIRTALPDRGAIEDPRHELRQAERLLAEDKIESRIVGTVRLLSSLIARTDESPYGGFIREESYFKEYPINLRALRHLALGKWRSLSVGEWLIWLIRHWCVGHHLTVALRKLYAQGLDTFRLRPTELGFQPVKNIDVSYGNPRLRQTLRALRDLGMIDSNHKLTSAGMALRKELHG